MSLSKSEIINRRESCFLRESLRLTFLLRESHGVVASRFWKNVKTAKITGRGSSLSSLNVQRIFLFLLFLPHDHHFYSFILRFLAETIRRKWPRAPVNPGKRMEMYIRCRGRERDAPSLSAAPRIQLQCIARLNL